MPYGHARRKRVNIQSENVIGHGNVATIYGEWLDSASRASSELKLDVFIDMYIYKNRYNIHQLRLNLVRLFSVRLGYFQFG